MSNLEDMLFGLKGSNTGEYIKSEEEIYKANYMQKPFAILTEENLDRLEKHCKKAIHYERGNIKEEHQIVLQLIYEYKNSVSKDAIRNLKEFYIEEGKKLNLFFIPLENLTKNINKLLKE